MEKGLQGIHSLPQNTPTHNLNLEREAAANMEANSMSPALAVKPWTPIIKSSSRDQLELSCVTLNKSLYFPES